MDAFLVRKRPFAAHEEAAAEAATKKQKQHGGGAINRSSSSGSRLPSVNAGLHRFPPSAATGSSSYSSSSYKYPSSSSYSTSSPLRSSSNRAIVTHFDPRPAATSYSSRPKQLTLQQLKKVTDIDSVRSMCVTLESALTHSNLSTILKTLRHLDDDVFVTTQVLSETGLGLTVGRVKKAMREQLQVNAAAVTSTSASDTPAAAASSSSTSALVAAPSDVSAEEEAIDLTSDEHKSDQPAAAASSSSAAHSTDASLPGPPLSAEDSLRTTILSLAARLITVWKIQVQKEAQKTSLTVDSTANSASLIFGDYSTHIPRIKAYKAFYYKLTEKDHPETYLEKQTREKASQQLIPKDLDAARMAAELERTLFLYEQAIVNEKAMLRRKQHGAELLSQSKPDDDSAANLQLNLPPAYISHSRALLMLITQPQQLEKLRPWITTYEEGSALTPDQIEMRKQVYRQLVEKTKLQFA